MISKVTIQNFKRFKAPTEFVLKPEGVTFLAGGNNSGKSTLLQALAVWEFARSVIEVNKDKAALLAGSSGQGVGVSAEEFSPIVLPNLKHLWSDLKVSNGAVGGYTLRIRCDWQTATDPPADRYLEFGFALANDRLFLKRTTSNLTAEDAVPRMAYLPPFAGITSREERMSHAARKRWMGRGLAGAVLRNLLYDFWDQNSKAREQARGVKRRIPKSELVKIRKSDAWEQLRQVLGDVFQAGLSVNPFNDLYHTTIDVAAWEGQLANKQFRKKPGVPEKDLMVEGSGFLQWLSVYALALNKELDVLLLDEPDAHLHPTLQGHLIHNAEPAGAREPQTGASGDAFHDHSLRDQSGADFPHGRQRLPQRRTWPSVTLCWAWQSIRASAGSAQALQAAVPARRAIGPGNFASMGENAWSCLAR